MQNSVASILQKVGYGIIIIGFIGGFISANNDALTDLFYSSFVWTIAITTWICAFIVGMFFIGFAEIIEIQYSQSKEIHENKNTNKKILIDLQNMKSIIEYKQEIGYKIKDNEQDVKKINHSQIANAIKTDENKELVGDANTPNEKVKEELIDVSDMDLIQIKKYYPDRDIKKIDRITITPFEGIYMVYTTINRELISFHGFMPMILSETDINKIIGLKEWYERNINKN